MDISTLQNLEASGAYARVEQQLAGLKSSRDPQVLQYATAYYVRRGNPTKSLACYAEYVQATTAAERDLGAVAMAIECARRLGKTTLVTEYFLALGKSERETLPADCLITVATAFAALGHIEEAEKIGGFIRARAGAPQLKSFNEVISDEFGDQRAVRSFIEKTPAQFDRHDVHGSINRAMSLALAHMAEGNYSTAVGVLEKCKAVVS